MSAKFPRGAVTQPLYDDGRPIRGESWLHDGRGLVTTLGKRVEWLRPNMTERFLRACTGAEAKAAGLKVTAFDARSLASFARTQKVACDVHGFTLVPPGSKMPRLMPPGCPHHAKYRIKHDGVLGCLACNSDRNCKPEPHGEARSKVEEPFWSVCRCGNEARLRRALDDAWAAAGGRPLVWATEYKEPRARRRS